MALITIETTGKLQRQQNAIFWKVCDKTKKLVINRNDELMPIENSIELLRDTLKDCIGDYCSVTLYTEKPTQLEKGSTKGKIFELLVKLDSTQYNQSPINGTSSNFSEMLELHKKVMQLEFEKKQADERDEAIQQKPLEKLVDKLTEGNTINLLLSAFMNKLNKQPESISGAPADLKPTIEKLSKVDPDYINTLQKMAIYLEKNPGVLPQIKMIIGA